MTRLSIPSQMGSYRIERFIAKGLTGEVYKAQHDRHGTVALKIFTRDDDKAVFNHFIHEQRLLREVTEHRGHPSIVAYASDDRGRAPHYLATRFIEHAQEIDRLLGRPLPPAQVVAVVEQIGSALDYLHFGNPRLSPIIHRDVKPHNILLDNSGRAVLLDLSVACSRTFDLAVPQQFGTPQYMAPEQYRNAEEPQTDQFSLAAVAYEMLVGVPLLRLADTTNARAAYEQLERLYVGEFRELQQLLRQRPQTSAVLQRALAYQPTERYASCEEFAYELRQALKGDGVQFEDQPRPTGAKLLSRNNLMMAAIVVLTAIALLLALSR